MERTPPPKPGIYPDVDFVTYLSWDAADFTTLKLGRRAWAIAYEYMANPPPDAAHLGFGRLYHCLTLEPETWTKHFAVIPETYPATVTRGRGENKTTVIKQRPWTLNATWCKDWRAEREADNLALISAQGTKGAPGFAEAQEMATKARNDERIGAFIQRGQPEVSAVAQCPRTGELVKCRFDTWIADFCMAIDLKSTRCAHEDRWWPEAYRLSYHIQAAIYIDVMRWLRLDEQATEADTPWFCFLAQDKDKPFLPKSYDVQDDLGSNSFDFLAAGRRAYHVLLAEYAKCRSTGIWPGYNTDNSDMILPYHAQERLARERNDSMSPNEEEAWPNRQ